MWGSHGRRERVSIRKTEGEASRDDSHWESRGDTSEGERDSDSVVKGEKVGTVWVGPVCDPPPAHGTPAGHTHTPSSKGSRARGGPGIVSVFPAGRGCPVGQR